VSKDLLFELGTEEIPPAYSPIIADNLTEDVNCALTEARLDYQDLTSYYTPRRTALLVTDLDEKQPDRRVEYRGPSEEIGLGEDGDFAIPARKFAEGHGATVDDLTLRDTEEGTYFFVEQLERGKRAQNIIPELFTDVITSLEQPETMRWDDSGIKFIRPIRWITCLFGGEVLSFKIGSVQSGADTTGHRFHGRSTVTISDPREYKDLLRTNKVLVDPEERKNSVAAQVDRKAADLGASVAVDGDFIDLLANSLEYPTLISGSFPEEYLDLPSELLFKTLTDEARLIPLVDAKSEEPLPQFFGFRDGVKDTTGEIKKGYESVINARLRDSKFFFEHDREGSLERFCARKYVS